MALLESDQTDHDILQFLQENHGSEQDRAIYISPFIKLNSPSNRDAEKKSSYMTHEKAKLRRYLTHENEMHNADHTVAYVDMASYPMKGALRNRLSKKDSTSPTEMLKYSECTSQFFEYMPLELTIYIMCFLRLSDIASIARTCSYFYYLTYEDSLWRSIYYREFGSLNQKDERMYLKPLSGDRLPWKQIFYEAKLNYYYNMYHTLPAALKLYQHRNIAMPPPATNSSQYADHSQIMNSYNLQGFLFGSLHILTDNLSLNNYRDQVLLESRKLKIVTLLGHLQYSSMRESQIDNFISISEALFANLCKSSSPFIRLTTLKSFWMMMEEYNHCEHLFFNSSNLQRSGFPRRLFGNLVEISFNDPHKDVRLEANKQLHTGWTWNLSLFPDTHRTWLEGSFYRRIWNCFITSFLFNVMAILAFYPMSFGPAMFLIPLISAWLCKEVGFRWKKTLNITAEASMKGVVTYIALFCWHEIASYILRGVFVDRSWIVLFLTITCSILLCLKGNLERRMNIMLRFLYPTPPQVLYGIRDFKITELYLVATIAYFSILRSWLALAIGCSWLRLELDQLKFPHEKANLANCARFVRFDMYKRATFGFMISIICITCAILLSK